MYQAKTCEIINQRSETEKCRHSNIRDTNFSRTRRGKKEENSGWTRGKGGRADLCCVVSASTPSSVPVEREQREKGEMFLLQFLCLICNRPISSATIPAGQLTNGRTFLKLGRIGEGIYAISHSRLCLSRKFSTASKDINFSGTPCRCYLLAMI